jgi:glycosyltransferase 2 family protein
MSDARTLEAPRQTKATLALIAGTDPPRSAPDRVRGALAQLLKILISVALMVFALRKIDFHTLVSRLDLGSLGWIALAILTALLQVGLGGLRWREIAAECGLSLTMRQALRFTLIGTFFNQALPSSIGGDAMRIWLAQRGGVGWRPATYSVIVDRAMGMIVLAMLVVATLPWSYRLISDVQGRYALLLIDFAALAGGIVFLATGRLGWRWLQTRWQTRDLFACSQIANRVIFSARRGPRIGVLSLFIHVLNVTVIWCAVRSIEAPVTFFEVFELIPPVILVTAVPISIAGWGVREASMGLAFGYAGLLASEGVNVSLLFGATALLVGALGGFTWIASPEKA